MHRCYRDIRSRIPEEPQWWDEHAVPRYTPFHPKRVANIYAHTVAFVRIACQNCGRTFDVAMSWDHHTPSPPGDIPALDSLHYGDPPNDECCASGPTMNCDDLQVLEFWSYVPWATRPGDPESTDWMRRPEFEVLLPDHPERRSERKDD